MDWDLDDIRRDYPPGLARVIAFANVAVGLDLSRQGVDYYLEETVGRILDEPACAASAPPDAIEVCERAVAILRTRLELTPEIVERLRDRWKRRGSQPDRSSSGRRRSATALVHLAVVAQYPEVDGRAVPVPRLGLVLPCTVSLEKRTPGRVPVQVVGRALSAPDGARLLGEVGQFVLGPARDAAERYLRRKGKPESVLMARRFTERFAFDLRLDSVETRLAGESSGIGLAAVFMGAISDCSRGRGFRPRRDLVWTGRVGADGRVGDVGIATFRDKVRSALANQFRGIVVPATMVDVARAVLPTDAEFKVFGVASLDEIPGNDELCEPWSPIPRPVWRSGAFLGFITALLLTLLARSLAVGPNTPGHVASSEDKRSVQVYSVRNRLLWIGAVPDSISLERVEACSLYVPVPARPKDVWVYARTKESDEAPGSHLLFWNSAGRLDLCLASECSSYWGASPELARMRYFDARPAGVSFRGVTPMVVTQGAHHVTSQVSVLLPDPRSQRLVLDVSYRFLHAGNFTSTVLTAGLEGESLLLWMLAIESDGAVRRWMPESAKKIFSLIVAPVTEGNSVVYLPRTGDQVQESGARGRQWDQSRELFSFALVGYRLVDGDIDRSEDQGFTIRLVHSAGNKSPKDYYLELKNGNQLSVARAGGDTLDVNWIPARRLSEAAARLPNYSGTGRVGDILTDSMAFLTSVDPRWVVRSNCRTLEEAAPPATGR